MISEVIDTFKQIIPGVEFYNPSIWYLYLLFIFLCLYLIFIKRRNIKSISLRLLLALSLIAGAAIPFKSSTSFLDTPHKIFLLDVSRSMSDDAIKDCLTKAIKIAPDTKIKVYPFDGKILDPLELIPAKENEIANKLLQKRGESLTDYEESFRLLSSHLQSEDILICSDGRETSGSINTLFPELKRKKIRIHPFFPDNRLLQPDEVIVTSFSGPLFIQQGETAQFTASVKNPTKNRFAGKAIFSRSNKNVAEKNITVESAKEELVSEYFRDLPVGIHKITFSVPGEDEKSRWIEVKERPRFLVIHGKASEMTLLENLLKTLAYEKESIVAGRDRFPESLTGYTGIIINNVSEKQIARDFQQKIRKHIEEGNALLILGGDASFGLGGYAKSVLEELSPLESVPPRAKVKKLPSAVALVIDKSGSMQVEGRMMGARLAALNTIQGLGDEDFIAVIGFDHAPLVVMDLQKVSAARPQAEVRLRNLTPDGGTNLLPALSRARYRLASAAAGKKHIIVLTDGVFPSTSNNFANEVNTIKREGITMSTVALGLDADVPFMKLLAQQGGGNFYQVLNANTLPKIFLDDVKVVIGEDTMKEQSDFPVLPGPAGISSTTIAHFPLLKGFVETKPKSKAQVELITKKDSENFPIFAHWLFGKGRVFAFTSDLVGRWSSTWLKWPQIGNFWDDIFKKLRGTQDSTSDDIKFDVRYHVQGNRLFFELFVYEKLLGQIRSGTAELQSREDTQKQNFTFERKEAGRFEASLLLAKAGDYILSIQLDSTVLPQVGVSVSARELGEIRGQGTDVSFLSRLARETGGTVNPSSQDLKSRERKEIVTPETYSVPFVLLSLILLIIEVFIRERRKS